ncbi:unnamed protein product [Paramecium pentaurelia]|uniref:Uncharacterized protein n=1 Tax=Paramecium pentaurelia TaxID=43138 RepID=A0A8S1TCJ5_9CILI|nr:unnamed protein product [Paramecium pentaurelia]
MNFAKYSMKEINKQFWSKQSITNSSMLGGYDQINNVDIQQSELFLLKNIQQFNTLLELGSGIGRISEQLFIKYFKEIHLVEREAKFLNESRRRLSKFNCLYYQMSVEEFEPKTNYDCVWIQWISMYLTDSDFCNMLQKFNKSPIILKENISSQDYQYDEEDASITRSERIYENLIKKSGFKIMDEQFQQGLPNDIYKIKFYLLKHQEL